MTARTIEKPNNIDHPPHYIANGIEVIDVIEAFGLSFHRGNAIKYLLRAGRKDEIADDLKKARWYIDRELSRLAPQQNRGRA